MKFNYARLFACSTLLLFNFIYKNLAAQNAGVTIRGAFITVPAGAVINIPGNLKISGPADYILNNGSVMLSGNFINAGNSFSASGTGAAIFNGISVISGTKIPVFNHLVIKPNAIVTLASNIDIKNDWTNNGLFAHGSKQVSFSGAVPVQNIFGSGTFYDLILQNSVNFRSSRDTIEHAFSNSAGTMDGGNSKVVFKNSPVNIIGSNAKNFHDLEILNSASVNHTTGSGNIHVSNSFVNNGSLVENTAYTFFFDKSNVTESMSGTGTTVFGKLVIGDAGFSFPTILNCSADFAITGGSVSFNKNSIYNGISNTVVFSTTAATVSGSGTANFYNVAINTGVNLGSGISVINKTLVINSGGFITVSSPFYGSSSTLIYNTTTPTLNTGLEWTGNTGSTGFGSPYHVKVQNTNNVVLLGSRAVPGFLMLDPVNSLDINNNSLTVNGGFAGTGVLKGSVASELVTAGSGTIFFDTETCLLKILTVNNSGNISLGSNLHIAPGNSAGGYGTVTVNGVLESNGFLTLRSDINGTARINASTGVISGDVTVERFIPGRRAWRFLTVPFREGTGTSINASWQEGQTSATLTCPSNDPAPAGYGTHITYNGVNGYDQNMTNNPSLKIWENNTWVTPSSTLTQKIADYAGYCVFVRGDRHICLSKGTGAGCNNTILRACGVLNQTGSFTVSKTYVSGNPGGFIFVGNPYASSIDIAPVIGTGRSNGIEYNKFWVWDPRMAGDNGVGGYVVFANGLQAPPGSSSYTSGTVIQSGQAFMLKLEEAGASATINFRETDKTVSETNVFGLRARTTYPAIFANLMTPSGDKLILVDGVGAGFGKRFSANVDKDDATKLWNFNENMALIRNGKALAIEFRPLPDSTDTLFFRLYLKQQPYVLQLFSANLPANIRGRVWLVDKYLNQQTEINISDTALYSFTPNSDTNSYRNRFMLVLDRDNQIRQTERVIPVAHMEKIYKKRKLKIRPELISHASALNVANKCGGIKSRRFTIPI
ncbi:MAG TPA: hypothetical protein VFW07_06475 [Parafilimonas sp.]|nr:hypothetical protein [Parafilimonas sp.]